MPASSALAASAVAVIAKIAGDVKDGARFLWARSILKPPSWYAQVAQILHEKYPHAPVVIVDPYTFFGLIRLQYNPE